MGVYSKTGNAINSVYSKGGILLNIAYAISGAVVYRRGTIDYSDYEESTLFRYAQSNMQGFAYFNGKIAQVKEGSALQIIDISTGEKLKDVTMDMGHGNSCQFSTEYYADDDEFPLFYVRNEGVWVYRITDTTSTLIKKYSFSPDIIGTYVAGFGIDDANRRFYTASYTEGTYQSKTGLMRICSWDMDNEVDNHDGTFSFALIDSNDFSWFDRFDAVQGCCFYNGYFFISCGLNGTIQYVVAVNPSTLVIDHLITYSGTQETEGCAWIDFDTLIVGQKVNTYTYKRLVFSIVQEGDEA